MVSWRKFELPVLKFIAEQVKNDEVCRVLAAKYNEFKKSRIHGDVGELAASEVRLNETMQSIGNIVKAVEKGTAPDSLIQRLVNLEVEKKSLEDKIKFLRGMDQSEIYVTPTAIKSRFEEIPRLLQESRPFEVNRALKPLLGNKGVKLFWGPGRNGKECYWVKGTIDIGRAMGLAKNESATDAASVKLEVPIELELG